MRKLCSIQVLRGLAACAVVLLHSSGSATRGAAGVDLFFVISGFVMATIPKKTSFLFDRFWRIYPLWWIALIPWLWGVTDLRVIASSVTLWPLYGDLVRPALSVGWTLLFEMLFYGAIALSMRIGAKTVLAIFALMLAGAAFTHAPMFNYLGNPMIFEFLFGVAIAKLPRDIRFSAPLLVLAVICLAVSPSWVAHPDLALRAPASAWRVLYWGIPAAMVVYACLSAERPFTHRYWAVPVLLGDASYSIYLFHLGILKLLPPLWWPVSFVLAVAIAVGIWWFVERRIIALRPVLNAPEPA